MIWKEPGFRPGIVKFSRGVGPISRNLWSLQTLRLRLQTVALFTRQLSTLLGAGIGILQSFEALVEGADEPTYRRVVEGIANRVSQGYRLSQTLAQYPLIFPPVYLAVVKMGEETGRLVHCLSRVADWLEREVANRQMLRAAMVYPCFILALTGGLSIVLFYWVLPGLLSGLQVGKEGLPAITRLVLGLSLALQNPALWIVAMGIGGELFLTTRRLRSQPQKWLRVYSALLHLPGLGLLLRDTSLVRFCSSLEAMLAAGAPLLPGLSLAAKASDNPVIQSQMPAIMEEVRAGSGVATALARRPALFPPILTTVMACGEEAGGLRKMLQYMEAAFQEQAHYRLEALKALTEPLLLATVASIVAIVILAVFLPLYGSLSSLGG